MKALLNWRYYVMIALSTIGILFLLVSFGDPVEEISLVKEMSLHFFHFGISMLAFYILKRAVIFWESKNLIPEFTKLLKEDV